MHGPNSNRRRQLHISDSSHGQRFANVNFLAWIQTKAKTRP